MCLSDSSKSEERSIYAIFPPVTSHLQVCVHPRHYINLEEWNGKDRRRGWGERESRTETRLLYFLFKTQVLKDSERKKILALYNRRLFLANFRKAVLEYYISWRSISQENRFVLMNSGIYVSMFILSPWETRWQGLDKKILLTTLLFVRFCLFVSRERQIW